MPVLPDWPCKTKFGGVGLGRCCLEGHAGRLCIETTIRYLLTEAGVGVRVLRSFAQAESTFCLLLAFVWCMYVVPALIGLILQVLFCDKATSSMATVQNDSPGAMGSARDRALARLAARTAAAEVACRRTVRKWERGLPKKLYVSRNKDLFCCMFG